MPGKALVLDANILVRAVLGTRVRRVIEIYAEAVLFFVPEVAYAEAEEHLPSLVLRRGGDPEKAITLLRSFDRELLERVDGVDSNRSAFLERAPLVYLARLEQSERDHADIAIINHHARRLNRGALETLEYQKLP
jgi:hypothetical protein